MREEAAPVVIAFFGEFIKFSTCLGALSGKNSNRKVPRSVVTTASRSLAEVSAAD